MQHINDYILAFLLVAVISFVPSRTIMYLITERKNDEKQVQKTFGIRPLEYWMTALLWDSFTAILFVALTAGILKAFGIKALAESSNLPAALLLMFFYCICMNCLVYLLEKAFHEPSLGQIVILTLSVFTGIATLILMLLLFFFWWIRPIVETRKLLSIVLLILPPYAAGKLKHFFQKVKIFLRILFFVFRWRFS